MDFDGSAAAAYPREYAAPAYLLDKSGLLNKSGFPATCLFAINGSDLEREMKTAGETWLAS